MRKTATIYYATVVGSEGQAHEDRMEPVRSRGKDPLGRAPEWCCGTLSREVAARTLVFQTDVHDRPPVLRIGGWTETARPVLFCPFCGAAIILKKHLTLRVAVRTTAEPQYEYYYEVVN